MGKSKPTIIPKRYSVVNCQFCFDEGLININKFKVYAYKNSEKFLFFKCLKCGRIMRARTVRWGGRNLTNQHNKKY